LPAKKAGRQSVKRRRRNVSARTETRGSVNKALVAIGSGDASVAEAALQNAISTLDRAVRKGIMHRNSAARRKSRISARFNKLLVS
jgi:small subunit ribosomal protein S20